MEIQETDGCYRRRRWRVKRLMDVTGWVQLTAASSSSFEAATLESASSLAAAAVDTASSRATEASLSSDSKAVALASAANCLRLASSSLASASFLSLASTAPASAADSALEGGQKERSYACVGGVRRKGLEVGRQVWFLANSRASASVWRDIHLVDQNPRSLFAEASRARRDSTFGRSGIQMA